MVRLTSPRCYPGNGDIISFGEGLHPDFETAVAEMTRVSRTFEPRPDARDVYEGLYHKVYKQMYRKLRPLYEEIQRITGYPPK